MNIFYTEVDGNLQQELNNLYKKVRELRQLYNKYKKMGEIIPDQNITRFKLSNTPDLFNTFKHMVYIFRKQLNF